MSTIENIRRAQARIEEAQEDLRKMISKVKFAHDGESDFAHLRVDDLTGSMTIVIGGYEFRREKAHSLAMWILSIADDSKVPVPAKVGEAKS
jgi:GTP cyclohydrolase III